MLRNEVGRKRRVCQITLPPLCNADFAGNAPSHNSANQFLIFAHSGWCHYRPTESHRYYVFDETFM